MIAVPLRAEVDRWVSKASILNGSLFLDLVTLASDSECTDLFKVMSSELQSILPVGFKVRRVSTNSPRLDARSLALAGKRCRVAFGVQLHVLDLASSRITHGSSSSFTSTLLEDTAVAFHTAGVGLYRVILCFVQTPRGRVQWLPVASLRPPVGRYFADFLRTRYKDSTSFYTHIARRGAVCLLAHSSCHLGRRIQLVDVWQGLKEAGAKKQERLEPLGTSQPRLNALVTRYGEHIEAGTRPPRPTLLGLGWIRVLLQYL